MSYNYRKMAQADISSCAKLETECFAHPWSENSFHSALDSGNTAFYVCTHNGDIVAYGGVQCVCGDGAITNIAVTEKCRGQGIGERILCMLIKHCVDNSTQQVSLEVRCSNTPAINLYKKHGFEILGVRKNFYSKPREDAYIMQKNGGQ